MKLTAQHTSVLIVGAGPSGLMMAAQLLRNGVQPLIIDSKQGPTTQSKALAVQARSLEIYRQLGVADTVIQNGKQAQGLIYNQKQEELAKLSVDAIGREQTLFPYVLVYQQYKNERVLLDYLTQKCCPVYWNTTFKSAKLVADRVEIVVTQDGEDVALTCDWLIGADGAHSPVRKEFEIPFKGDTYPHLFYLADVVLDENPGNYLHIHLSEKGFTAFFPMPEENNYRIIGNLPDGLGEDIVLNEVLPSLKAITGMTLDIPKCNWFTTYKLHHRMAEKFREGRCFLVGDAAHIHSPIGGQGMNTGLQDAYNLGWKLAGVVSGQFNAAILDSYAEERIPVAKTLLNTTDRAFNLMMANNFAANLFKKKILPRLLKFLWGKEKLREEFFLRISQLGISYRDSKLNMHLARGSKIKAGDRLPYLIIFDEKKLTETDLHQWCAQPGFTFIAMGKIAEMELFSLAKWINHTYPQLLNFYYLPPSPKNQHVFDAFEITSPRPKTLIVRPDMHIGLINDGINTDIIRNYMDNVMGVLKVKS